MAIKHLRAIVLLPVMVLVVIPAIIVYSTRSYNPGWSLPVPLQIMLVVLGLFFALAGLRLLVQTISLFITRGQGTLAPWDPTRRLVVEGVYRRVRNPMISGVIFILLGETLVIGSVPLVYWLFGFMLANFTYMPLVEEPGLERRFGEDYQLYKKNVPRWIPRRRPWNGLVESRRNC
jgi:protein-S-isoprenylcysteine O-methyltransferase Ste14